MRVFYDSGKDLKFEYYDSPFVMPFAHIHPRYEFYFCTKRVEQLSVVNGVEHRYKHPAVILSAPYTLHSMSCIDAGAEKYERYVIYFGERTMSSFDRRLIPADFFENSVGLLYELTEEEAEELSEILALGKKCGSIAERELVFALFVNRLTSLCPPERVMRVGTKFFYIQDVLRYIAENLGNRLNIMDIASIFAVSRSKLDRDFKKFTGMTVHNYIDVCRVNEARYLLDKGDSRTVAEIAAACGFESESCFFHFFRRVTGKAPSEYRAMKNTAMSGKNK